jgi:hypothetical protein
MHYTWSEVQPAKHQFRRQNGQVTITTNRTSGRGKSNASIVSDADVTAADHNK